MQGSAQEERNVFQPEKRSRFPKKCRRGHPTPLKVSPNRGTQTYETEEACYQYYLKHAGLMTWGVLSVLTLRPRG